MVTGPCIHTPKGMWFYGWLFIKIKTGEFPISSPEKWFDKLEEQGVLFLNASLTVRRYEVNTHSVIWEDFVNELILYLQQLNPDTKWCLFGNSARDRVLPLINNADENVLLVVHPRVNSFIYSDVFEKLKETINFLV